MLVLKRFLIFCIFVLLSVGSSFGQGFDSNGSGNLEYGNSGFGIDEFRAGVLVHSIDEPGPGGEMFNFTRLQDVSFEILFTSPDVDFFRWIGSPRPNIGVTANFGGLESMAHLGLTWQIPLWDSAFFIEATLGAAIHNGALTGAVAPARNLGCLIQFYEAGGLGVNVTDDISVILAIEHASNANICLQNRGLTNLGVKVGFKF